MSLPNVTTYSIIAGNANLLASVGAIGPASFTLATTTLDAGRRVLITAIGNESANTFVISGLNAAGFPIAESIAGPNATTTQTNLDFKVVTSIRNLAANANTVSFGTYSTGSTLWNIMNWHVSPVNIEVSGVQVGTQGVTWTVQYTYDDPNNLPAGVQFPQPFNHPTLVNQTGSLDGPINDPITAVRLYMSGGTGTVRFTVIQAGIGSP